VAQSVFDKHNIFKSNTYGINIRMKHLLNPEKMGQQVTSSGRKTIPGILSASSSAMVVQYTGDSASITSFANFVTRIKSSSVTEAYNVT